MFFRNGGLIAKKLATGYLKVSAGGAAVGGAAGVFVSSVFTPTCLINSARHSNAKSAPGAIADGVEDVAKLWTLCVGFGIWAGASPITYPATRLYEHINKNLESKETQASTLKLR